MDLRSGNEQPGDDAMGVVRDALDEVLNRVDAAATRLSPEQLHQELSATLDDLMRRMGTRGYTTSEVDDVTYAVVALTDELVVGSSAEASAYWMSKPLQMKYFNETRAGDGFFERLEALRNRNSRPALLLVYYVCLLLGFKGRYGLRGAESELLDTMASLRRTLARQHVIFDVVDLAPRAARPREAQVLRQKPLAILTIPLTAVGLTAILYAILSTTIGMQAGRVVHYISSLLASRLP